MAEVKALPIDCQPQAPVQSVNCQPRSQPSDMDFDVARTFSVLTATLILPVFLALSVVSYSMAALY